jgi:hypothetical protein
MDRKRWRQAWIYLALGLLALANGGCLVAAAGVAAGGGAAGYAYYKGNICQEYNATFDDTWAAVHTALNELGLPILNEERTGPTGFAVSRTGEGDRVRIALDVFNSPIPVEGPVTRVGVRVATFGDQPLSDRILNQVGAHLVARQPSAPSSPTTIQPPPPPGSPPPARPITPAAFTPQTVEPPLVNPTPGK